MWVGYGNLPPCTAMLRKAAQGARRVLMSAANRTVHHSESHPLPVRFNHSSTTWVTVECNDMGDTLLDFQVLKVEIDPSKSPALQSDAVTF